MKTLKRFLIYVAATGLPALLLAVCLERAAMTYVRTRHVLTEHEQLIEEQGATPGNKQAGERRIFIVGESAALGIPFPVQASYTGYLRKLLELSDEKKVRVIHVAIPGRHSFRHRYLWKTLIQYKADAVILYSGNNDTKDFSNVIRDVRDAGIDFWLTHHSYFYAGIKRKILALKDLVNQRLGSPLFVVNRNEDDVWHWTDEYLQKKNDYMNHPARGRRRKLRAIQDYEENLDVLVKRLRSRGIEVYIVSLPVVHEFPPATQSWPRKGYVFEEKIPIKNASRQASWDEAFQRGGEALSNGDPAGALAFFERARSVYADYSLLAHRMGESYQKTGDYAKAKAFYEKANDLQIQSAGGDTFKIRALKRIAARHQAHWIDAQSACEQMSPHGIVGKKLFIDHAHSTSIGHKVIAAKTMEVLCETRFAHCPGAETGWPEWFEKLSYGEPTEENLAREYLDTAAVLMADAEGHEGGSDIDTAMFYLEQAREFLTGNVRLEQLLIQAKNKKMVSARTALPDPAVPTLFELQAAGKS